MGVGVGQETGVRLGWGIKRIGVERIKVEDGGKWWRQGWSEDEEEVLWVRG